MVMRLWFTCNATFSKETEERKVDRGSTVAGPGTEAARLVRLLSGVLVERVESFRYAPRVFN
jgi:hypothetical protein